MCGETFNRELSNVSANDRYVRMVKTVVLANNEKKVNARDSYSLNYSDLLLYASLEHDVPVTAKRRRNSRGGNSSTSGEPM